MNNKLIFFENDFSNIFELLTDENESVIFYAKISVNQINEKLYPVYSRFETIGLYDINTLNDLFSYIDGKSEIPEVVGLEKYMKELTSKISSYDRLNRQFIPLKINGETVVYSLKFLRLDDEEKIYYYLCKTDTTLINLEQLYSNSYKDKLTNLFNINALRLHTMDNQDHHFFGFFDLDGFKKINDTYTHKEGDKLLQLIGEKLISIANNNVVFYRYGGDEFVFMTIGLNSKEVDELVRKIRNVIYSIKFHDLNPTISLGYVEYDSSYNFNQTEAIMLADIGMYISKITGKAKSTYIDNQYATKIVKTGIEQELNKYISLTRGRKVSV